MDGPPYITFSRKAYDALSVFNDEDVERIKSALDVGLRLELMKYDAENMPRRVTAMRVCPVDRETAADVTANADRINAHGTHWHVEEIQISGSSQHMWA